ncbi:putative NADH-ubiquinone oxidoreductase B18 subunit [Viridothelium virens]|uniref:NADH dehydrogenase [ubiquinone] 1 beta subcomplex subunit 7 n=1 Tax=Viridothelium virens TaxID=1048519 RepID=A0A6A6HJ92_VIRVR|nr:putative NADH-ubiquinone oxidoreductase B18 subunit [Viridothelium virens]
MTVMDTIKDAVGLGHDEHGAPKGPATREQMSEAKLPLAYRDSCAHLLIPLNRCRYDQYFLPWKCETERHSYEKCQYEEFKKRVAKMDEIRAAKGGARSN